MADPEMIERNRNEDKMSRMVVDLNKRLSKIMEGGGKARQEKEREKGKMTARERIAYLLDENKPQIEIGAFAKTATLSVAILV